MMASYSKEKEDDQGMISELQGQNKELFESVYRQHYKKLYLLSYHYVRNHEVAEETVHDVFINIWKMQRQVIIEQSLKSYLSRSVINASLNYIKKEKQLTGKLDDYSRIENEVSEEPTDEKEQLIIRLEEALNLLPPQCKKVMLLSRFEKLKQQQIADQLGISIKTVKNHLTYGFNKLRGILNINTLLTVLLIILRMYIINSAISTL